MSNSGFSIGAQDPVFRIWAFRIWAFRI